MLHFQRLVTQTTYVVKLNKRNKWFDQYIYYVNLNYTRVSKSAKHKANRPALRKILPDRMHIFILPVCENVNETPA